MGDYVALGFFVLLVGMVLIMVGSLTGTEKKDVHVGIGGFIGPIPFGFANSPQMLKIVIGITAFFFIVLILMRFTKP